ncbi:DsrE family protein [Moraxella macacae]|nr:DsrE family protein [Moraxella macacae]
MTTLLFTHSPFSDSTKQGIEFIENFYKNSPNSKKINIFLYSDAVYLASRLNWLPSDMPNPVKNFQYLLNKYELSAKACVSTALARGIVDSENAKRHQIHGENIAKSCELVGLGELAMFLHNSNDVYQF